MKPLAIASCRVSTLEQRLENHSLERQEVSVQKAAAELGVEIIKGWSIDQSSRAGKNINRKDLLEMVAFCKRNRRVQYLIIDEVDRFMRSIDEFYYFVTIFKQLGVTIHFASQPALNSNDISAKVQKVISILGAEMDNDARRNKCTSGLKARVAQGYYPFPNHLGYVKSTTAGLHIPDPERFEPLRQAILEVKDRLYTPSQAAKRLSMAGFQRKTGNALQLNHFMKILRDEYYCGVVEVPSFGIRVEDGLHQPMLTKQQFSELQSVISGKVSKFHRKQYNPEFPLSKLMVCALCQGKFTGAMQHNGHGNIYPRYRCRNCHKQYSRETVQEPLTELLDALSLDKSAKADLLATLKTVWHEKQQSNVEYRRRLQADMERLKETKSNLILMLASHGTSVSQADIEVELKKLGETINEKEQQIHLTSDTEKDFIAFTSFVLDFIDNLRTNWQKLSPNNRLRCQQLLFPGGIYFHPIKKVSTTEISMLYRLATNKKDQEIVSQSLLVELRGIAPRSVRLRASVLQA